MDEFYGGEGKNITPSDLLVLPSTQMKTIRTMLRLRKATIDDVIVALTVPADDDSPTPAEIHGTMADLVEKGWLRREGEHYIVNVIDRTGSLNEDAPPPQVNRRRSGLNRLNRFFDRVTGGDEDAPPQGTGQGTQQGTGPNKSGRSLFDDLSVSDEAKKIKPSEDFKPKEVRANKRDTVSGISKIFDELAAPDDPTNPTPHDLVPPAGGRVSKLFEEFAAKPTPPEPPEKPAPKRTGKLFDEFTRKDDTPTNDDPENR